MKKNNSSKKTNSKKVDSKPIEPKNIEETIEPIIEPKVETKETIVSEKKVSEIGQNNYASTFIPEKPKYDYVTVKVDGNNCSASSKGFTKEEEKAIAMTMFQMRNRFGLESNFIVELRK